MAAGVALGAAATALGATAAGAAGAAASGAPAATALALMLDADAVPDSPNNSIRLTSTAPAVPRGRGRAPPRYRLTAGYWLRDLDPLMRNTADLIVLSRFEFDTASLLPLSRKIATPDAPHANHSGARSSNDLGRLRGFGAASIRGNQAGIVAG